MIPVVTGMGLVSSLGHDVRTSFAGFCRGESAVRPLLSFDRARYRVTSAYEIADDTATAMPGRASHWLRQAVTEALKQAGLGEGGSGRDGTVPVIVGTGLAEQRSLELWHAEGAPLNPACLDFGSALADLATDHGMTIVNACSAGLYALAIATDMLELGEAPAIVVAASDSISESMFGLLDRVNMRPPTEVRPFDKNRVGVILGEGAAAIVLEHPETARGRGAEPLARVRAVATTCDAHHETAPLRAGLSRTFREAHRRAGVLPRQIDLIMAHGTGTPLNDVTEAAALAETFGDDIGHPVVAALKSQIGHTSGASGLMSLVVAVEAMWSGQVPPVVGLTEPVSEARDFRFAHGRPHRAEVRAAQVNAFGFGGVNAVAVLDRGHGEAGGSPRVTAGRQTAAVSVPVAVTGIGLEIPGTDGKELLTLAAERNCLAWHDVPPRFEGGPRLPRQGLRYKDQATRLALSAVAASLEAAGFTPPPAASAEAAATGVAVSTNFAIAETVCRVVRTIHDGGVEATSAMDLPNASGNVAASSIAIRFGLAGHNITVSAGATSGTDAVYLAACAIRAGRVSRMVVVGVEAASEAMLELAGASDPRGAGRVPAQHPGVFNGAVAIVLESAASARARGARVQALVDGRTYHTDLAGSVGVPDDTVPAGSSPLWLVPCTRHQGVAAEVARIARDIRPDLCASQPPADLSAVAGEASGALGVLQVAAAAEWLATRRAGRAVVSSGGCWGAGFASLTMRGADA